jgi:hypothetical protein
VIHVTKIAEHSEERKLSESVRACLDKIEEAPRPAIFSTDEFLRSLDKQEWRDWRAYSRHCDRIWSRLPEPPERPRASRNNLPQERIADPGGIVRAEAEPRSIRARWPAEFEDGARCGLTGNTKGPREPGGYPKGFHGWPLDRRNTWFAGFNKGNSDRKGAQDD